MPRNCGHCFRFTGLYCVTVIASIARDSSEYRVHGPRYDRKHVRSRTSRRRLTRRVNVSRKLINTVTRSVTESGKC